MQSFKDTLKTASTSNKCSLKAHEYKKYVYFSTQWNRWLLKPMGAWPHSPNTSLIKKCFVWLLNVVCYGLISFVFIPCGLYVILDQEDHYAKLKLLGPLLFFIMTYLKYYSLIFHGNDIRECLDQIEWDWKNINHSEDRDIMLSTANFGNQLSKFSTIFMYSGLLLYYIILPISIGKVTAVGENLTFIPMIYPFTRYLIDTRQSPANEIIFTLQILEGILMNGIASAGCSLAAVFAMHACGQMKILMCMLDNLISGRAGNPKSVDGRIANIVSQHVRILKFLALIEKTISKISFIEVSGCTLDMCLVGYYIIVEWSSKDWTATAAYILILVSFTFNIFIFCYIGELVAEQCRMIGEKSYMIEWHRLPENKRLGIVLIIAMSNSTMKLTAGNLVKLTLSSFSDVVNTSVAFLNMLRTLT